MKQIVGVSIIYDGVMHQLPRPNRHPHVIQKIYEENGVGIAGPDEQGFVLDDGTFIGRRDALILAKQNGQLLPRSPGQYQGDKLFSEDLW